MAGVHRTPLRLHLRRMRADELEHAQPGVGALLLELGIVLVEEAVRRAGVDDDLVLDAGRIQRLVEALHVLERDSLVRAAKESEHRAGELTDALDRRRAASRAVGHSIEADDSFQIAPLVRLLQGLPAA